MVRIEFWNLAIPTMNLTGLYRVDGVAKAPDYVSARCTGGDARESARMSRRGGSGFLTAHRLAGPLIDRIFPSLLDTGICIASQLYSCFLRIVNPG